MDPRVKELIALADRTIDNVSPSMAPSNIAVVSILGAILNEITEMNAKLERIAKARNA